MTIGLELLAKSKYAVFIIVSVIGFAFHYPVLDNTFFSDDFDVIKRLAIDNEFQAPGFFRPLADLSLLLCYNLIGNASFYQYLLNIILLVLTSFCIYVFSIFYFKKVEEKYVTGLLAGILFAIYPFHNESIAWTVGRGSLLAGLFGILSLVSVFSEKRFTQRVLLANVFFFLGLAAYESIFPLPAIVLILMYTKKQPAKKYLPWLISYSATFFVHLVCRKVFSGSVFGGYQQEGLELHVTDYVVNFAKGFLRLWILPLHNSPLFTVFSVAVIILITAIIYFARRRQEYEQLYTNFLKFLACLCLSLIVPSIFSVGTKTSEGDRLLFFPSFFVIIFITLAIIQGLRKKIIFYAAFSLAAIYFGFCVILNNKNWGHASDIISQTLAQMRELSKENKSIRIINLPDSYYGAYIFRHGFKASLLMNGVDTAKINFISLFMRWDYDSTSNPLLLYKQGSNLTLPNYCSIVPGNDVSIYHVTVKDTLDYNTDIRNETLWFWDKQQYKMIDVR